MEGTDMNRTRIERTPEQRQALCRCYSILLASPPRDHAVPNSVAERYDTIPSSDEARMTVVAETPDAAAPDTSSDSHMATDAGTPQACSAGHGTAQVPQ